MKETELIMEIPLTQGMVAIVDADMYDELNLHKWYAQKKERRWYALRNVSIGNGKKTTVKMHQQIMSATGIDHINGNGLDNRRENLRLATKQQNMCNRGPQANNTSGFKGVYWDKQRGKWKASIKVNGKQKHIGRYITAEEAARVYDAMARQLHGEFARTNFGR